MTATPTTPAVAGARTWEQVLTELEAQIATGERLLHHGEGDEDALAAVEAAGAGWTPPTDLGPLPRSLARRAQELSRRQGEMLAKLQTATAEHRKQAKLVDSMKMDGAASPVLLDTDG